MSVNSRDGSPVVLGYPRISPLGEPYPMPRAGLYPRITPEDHELHHGGGLYPDLGSFEHAPVDPALQRYIDQGRRIREEQDVIIPIVGDRLEEAVVYPSLPTTPLAMACTPPLLGACIPPSHDFYLPTAVPTYAPTHFSSYSSLHEYLTLYFPWCSFEEPNASTLETCKKVDNLVRKQNVYAMSASDYIPPLLMEDIEFAKTNQYVDQLIIDKPSPEAFLCKAVLMESKSLNYPSLIEYFKALSLVKEANLELEYQFYQGTKAVTPLVNIEEEIKKGIYRSFTPYLKQTIYDISQICFEIALNSSSSTKATSKRSDLIRYFNSAKSYMAHNNYPAAREQVERIIEVVDDLHEVYLLQGYLYELSDNLDSAIEAYKKAYSSSKNPSSKMFAESYLICAQLLKQQALYGNVRRNQLDADLRNIDGYENLKETHKFQYSEDKDALDVVERNRAKGWQKYLARIAPCCAGKRLKSGSAENSKYNRRQAALHIARTLAYEICQTNVADLARINTYVTKVKAIDLDTNKDYQMWPTIQNAMHALIKREFLNFFNSDFSMDMLEAGFTERLIYYTKVAETVGVLDSVKSEIKSELGASVYQARVASILKFHASYRPDIVAKSALIQEYMSIPKHTRFYFIDADGNDYPHTVHSKNAVRNILESENTLSTALSSFGALLSRENPSCLHNDFIEAVQSKALASGGKALTAQDVNLLTTHIIGLFKFYISSQSLLKTLSRAIFKDLLDDSFTVSKLTKKGKLEKLVYNIDQISTRRVSNVFGTKTWEKYVKGISDLQASLPELNDLIQKYKLNDLFQEFVPKKCRKNLTMEQIAELPTRHLEEMSSQFGILSYNSSGNGSLDLPKKVIDFEIANNKRRKANFNDLQQLERALD